MEYVLQKGKYLVVGLGVTGTALIDFLLDREMIVVGYEELSGENFGKTKEKFKGKAVEFYLGSLPQTVFENLKAVFVSPGVGLTRPWNDEAKRRSIPVIGELELASRYLQGKIIAVTGTNGKSTTVSLLHEILKAGGFSSSLKGNIGSPLLTEVGRPPRNYYVVEASSYQLETISCFHPAISVVLNVTADHLERYPDMEAYAAAKARIMMNQTADDFFIANADDPYCRRMAKEAPCRTIPFSLVNRFDEGGFIDGNKMVIRWNGCETQYPLDHCSLRGLHNQENMLAAVLSATVIAVGAAPTEETIRMILRTFKSLPHRLEEVGIFRGIRFYDDSKGTNVGSVVMSLASFEKGVILILGGRDKGGDYAPLVPLIRAKGKGIVVLGEAQEKIAGELEGVKPVHRVKTMKEAVEKSFEIGSTGDVVLLSPACSSFDQYKNYAERGDDFKKWVFHFGGKK